LYVLENLTGGEEFWREKNAPWPWLTLGWNQDKKAALSRRLFEKTF
jgi:hypothetical protein